MNKQQLEEQLFKYSVIIDNQRVEREYDIEEIKVITKFNNRVKDIRKNEKARERYKRKKEKEYIENKEFYEGLQKIIIQNAGDTKCLSYLQPMKETKKSINIEQIKEIYNKDINKWSEISITFQPLYRINFSDEQIRDILEEIIIKYYKDIEILLIPEYGKSYNLHFHGYIKGKSTSISKLKKQLLNQVGRLTLKDIRYRDSYINYILKETDNRDIYDRFIISNLL